ncbi:hypothetical protein LSH36_648g01070 [Paralvinella palmiformis]|uniref:Lipase maturation factor n=1 Tax=Paralvinella palmiformis TaxID=53620 RepID=A0AAD9J3C8_9ANNE|nr:hypothetical protein LSH36_648g01070 [Paralvinella palmiformis]
MRGVDKQQIADDGTHLRQRRTQVNDNQETPDKTGDDSMEKEKRIVSKFTLENGTFWLTRIVLLRYVAFIYFVGFLVAFHQNRALLGKNGLLPANIYLKNLKNHVGGDIWDQIQHAPTLLWFVDYENNIDWWMSAIALVGLTASGFVILWGAANMPIMILLWMLYHSIVNVGQRWYSFGWESQILETGFLCIFLCPLLSLRRLPKDTPTSKIVIWLFTWLIFRIMLGATQPVPNPMSYYMHQEPEPFHKFETLVNHFVELIAPFFLLLTRRLRIIGALIQVLFQSIIIISGNLSFLNWLTIAPCLASFDDASLAWLFPSKRGATKWQVWQLQQEDKFHKTKTKWSNYVRRTLNLCIGILLAYLSIPIVQNLLSTRQIMNTSFDPLRIVNTYGAFGSITKERTEVIFQGTYDNPDDPDAVWEEYEFKCKPGSISRRPCIISPYHYRLDWLMWFAAFQNYQYNNWLVHLAGKFLMNDEGATSLIAYNPFEGKDPPRYVRAEHFRYIFTKIGSKPAKSGAWWKRTKIGNYLPAVSLESLKDYMKANQWHIPRLPRRRSRKA